MPLISTLGAASVKSFGYGSGVSGLYPFSSHTFTHASGVGREGRILSDFQAEYSGAPFIGDPDLFNVTTSGYQDWTIPITGNYLIQVYGAKGGDQVKQGSVGGDPAQMSAIYFLSQGQALRIICGHAGIDTVAGQSGSAGGGGGSFVILGESISSFLQTNLYIQNNILIAAGGGGAAVDTSGTALVNGRNASLTSSGTPSNGGDNLQGNGGGGGQQAIQAWSGAGGSGIIGNGGFPRSSSNNDGFPALRYEQGFIGGQRATLFNYGQDGGFGGGAGGSWGGAGGGGYSGGSADESIGSGDDKHGGGGGGSYIRQGLGWNQTVTSAIATGNINGKVIITFL